MDLVGLKMALGQFADQNLSSTGVLSGGAWSADLPLSNLQDDARYVGAPARQLNPADPTSARFDLAFARGQGVNLVGVLFHTLSLSARYRLRLAPQGGSLEAPSFDTGWAPVYGRVFPSEQIAWEQPNWWTGQLLQADIDLYRRHLWIGVAPVRIASMLRLEFEDASNADGYFDIGGLWVSAAWSPQVNFDRGRTLSSEPRDLVDEAPSGRRFGEERTPRRKVAVSWSMLAEAEAGRLFDAGSRARTTRTVVFIPDLDDPLSLAREAFPATFEQPPSPKFTYEHGNQVSATLQEIIA